MNSDPIDMDKFNTEAIAQHLKKGSFAPIFEQSNEKDNDIALKLMCIIDFHAQKLDLYKRVQDSKSPKLLTKLMQFSSFGTFKYFDYQVGKRIGKRVLKCKFCELVGPYGLILTHTVINHNVHIGLKNCAYCHRTELNEHLNEDVLHECYAKYMEREHIERDEVVCDIVTEFYAMLKRLSDKLKITTPRHHSFGGKGHKDAERFGRGGDNDIDTDENETVFKIRKSKNISGRSGPLDREFKRVISILYGGNNFSRLIQQQSVNAYSNGNDQAITISDVDETRSTAAATQAQRYLVINI